MEQPEIIPIYVILPVCTHGSFFTDPYCYFDHEITQTSGLLKLTLRSQ